MSESRFAVPSDEQWEQIQPCLPSSDGRRGRPFRDSHQIVEGIVYRYRTGIPWRDLPRERFEPWQTVWKRRRYGAREPAGHDIGRSRGGLTTKIHAVVDGNGRPLAAVVTGGQRNDGAMLIEVLAEIRVPRLGPGRPRTRPDAVLADRAYTSRINRGHLARRGITGVIPQKRDEIAARQRRGSRGGRPPGFDAVAYKGRNVVERSFALAKQWRGLATRYDKLALTYRAAVVLAACITWTKIYETCPSGPGVSCTRWNRGAPQYSGLWAIRLPWVLLPWRY